MCYRENDNLFFCFTYLLIIIMAGQEVSLSLIRSGLHHVSNAFMAEHKSKKVKKVNEPQLTPKDRVELFVKDDLARYCAFNHLQDGVVLQVAVPAVWREAITIIGGDDDMPMFVEGIKVINPENSQSLYFAGKSSRWVLKKALKRAKRMLYARTYLVRYSEQDGYKPELLLDNDDWLEGEKVKQAAKKLAALYDDQIDVCVYLGRVQIENGKSIKAAWCLGMRNMATKAIVCDLDNGALHFVNVEDITALARDVFYLKTDLMCFQNEGQLPWRLVRMD